MRVTVESAPATVVLAVTDSGEGIPPHLADAATGRFWRGPDADAAGGSGLGLAIVRATAERHGGKLIVDGPRFAIELPALRPLSGGEGDTADARSKEGIVNILRRASTTRIIIAGALIVLAAGAASIALASRSAGPTPPKRSLASAIHHALAGPRVAGVTARIRFSNHLLASGVLPDSSQPLLSGATGRLWATGGKARLELQADNGDTEIGFDGTTLTVYNVATNTAYTMAMPKRSGADHAATSDHGVPSIARIQQALDKLAGHVSLSGAIAGDIAGQPAYTVRVSPKHDGGLLGAVELAFDANHAVPLRVAVSEPGRPQPGAPAARPPTSASEACRRAISSCTSRRAPRSSACTRRMHRRTPPDLSPRQWVLRRSVGPFRSPSRRPRRWSAFRARTCG